ncbi:hypothetical protein [Acinetobacter oleivorans]|uniref:hypothetical protein n=1 Tax=Acinetobacter oleivorans TaxID=1148157 RepID=UPI0012501FEB|nr:hypothetical protein [Acinetobacter oleivorans]
MSLSFLNHNLQKTVGLIFFMGTIFWGGVQFNKTFGTIEEKQESNAISQDISRSNPINSNINNLSPVTINTIAQDKTIKDLESLNAQLQNRIIENQESFKKWKEYENNTNLKLQEYVNLLNKKDIEIKNLSTLNNKIKYLENDNELLNKRLENPFSYNGSNWSELQRKNLEDRVKSNDAKLQVLYQKLQ